MSAPRRSLLALLALAGWLAQASAQGVKGAGGSFSSSSFNQQAAGLAPSAVNSNGQLSSSFISMFNSLTPNQQQQFVRQMSSSNKRFFQQAVAPVQQNSAFSEEISSSSGGSLQPISVGGTKSASFKSSSSSSGLSPAQQAAFFRSQQSKSLSSNSQPSSQFAFSRQVQQQQSVPQFANANEFQSQKTIVNTVQAQPQQQSFFNQVQRVQQVAQPVVLPTSEQSFRRVQSFSSQPLPSSGSSESAFNLQFSQQQQPIPQTSAFNRFQQSSFSTAGQPVQSGFTNQFSSNSASSNLAGGGANLGAIDVSGFSGALQQEKVDASSGAIDGSFGQSQLTGGSNFNSFNQQQLANGGYILPSSNFESSSNAFESSDAQQKNINLPDDFSGLTAASINNRWYIMKPVDNPSALGLGDASSSLSGAQTSANIRPVPISRALLASRAGAAQLDAIAPITKSAAQVSSTRSTSGSSTAVPKKRSAKVEKSKREDIEETTKPTSSSSSLNEADEEDEERR